MIKKIIKQFHRVLISTKEVVNEWYSKSHQEFLSQQTYRQQNQMQERIYAHMRQVQQEVFLAFQYSKYPKLSSINIAGNIRIDNYEIKNGNYVYYFTISKCEPEPIAHVICCSICSDMNRDIIHFQSALYDELTPNDIAFIYPNYYYGIKILAVENIGTSVRIAVMTYRTP